MKKKHKVTSQYINPDRLIDTLRKQLSRATENLRKDWDKFKEYRDSQVENAPKPIITWNKGNFNEQSLLALTPDDLHVGIIIQEVGRVVEVTEKFNTKNEPVTVFKYELIATKIVPSILKTGHELKDVKV